MFDVDRAGRKLAGRLKRDERIQLLEQGLGDEGPLRLALLLCGAEEEHPVLHDRTAERSAELLAAERRLVAVGLPGEVVLCGQPSIALVAERGAVELIGAGLGHERNGRAARSSVCR